MGMNLGNRSGRDADPDVVVEINTTPLIDVMLVLLIMLIITIPIQTHAVKLEMPQASAAASNAPPPPAVEIKVEPDGSLLWDGTPMDRETLEQNFRREGRSAGEQQREFHIRPDRRVEYKYVAGVVAAAQRSGVVKIGIIGNEQFL